MNLAHDGLGRVGRGLKWS